jgi:CrcB protein
MRWLLILAGGAVGSVGRYLVTVSMADRLGAALPWGTLTVNLVGSFLIGLIATLADEVGSIGPQARLFLIVGVLGGFTTFSSFSLESFRLVEQHELPRALMSVVGSVALGFAAALLGIAAGRGLIR